MDQTLLVSNADLELGWEFVRLLRASNAVRMEAAFWWFKDGDWRFVVATPVVHEKGRIPAYRLIEKATGTRFKEFEVILRRLDVISPSEGVVTVLDIGARPVPKKRFVLKENVRGVYIEGAYFYHFAPQTFMPLLEEQAAGPEK